MVFIRKKKRAHMNAAIPKVDNCCDKEAFAFFGLAAYYAQVIEHGALNLAVVLSLPEVNLVSRELHDELFEHLSKRTFGQLLKASRSALAPSLEEEELLEKAVELRNMLIHRYFSERADEFFSLEGQNEMKKELRGIIAKFVEADNLIEKIYLPLWRRHGVTEEFVQEEMERVRRSAELRDQSL